MSGTSRKEDSKQFDSSHCPVELSPSLYFLFKHLGLVGFLCFYVTFHQELQNTYWDFNLSSFSSS
jgi:hypothetical protein